MTDSTTHARPMLRLPLMALIVFVSGFCSLVYQTVWFREFRLVFGASTISSAAVMAIFLGGLGVGGVVLGRRIDQSERPLHLYARLEIGIALMAALSPFLLDIVRWLYLSAGGSANMGNVVSSIVRLILSVLVIGPSVVLMGGTLPAAAGSSIDDSDAERTGLSLLYGANTIGAVTGVLVSTFFMFESFGFRTTLWMTCALNVALGMACLMLEGRSLGMHSGSKGRADARDAHEEDAASLPRWLVLSVAFSSGFVFLLAELVWYRMSSPILGGSTYTIGVVLAVALAGIGTGGLLHKLFSERLPATPTLLSMTCALLGLALIAPWAMGDDVATLAHVLRTWGSRTFGLLSISWIIVTTLIVFPASLIAGYQFPILFSLRGSGREGVGEDVGDVYAANTLGSVLGSLLGGFFIIPALGASLTWIACALAALALSVLVLARSSGGSPRARLATMGLGALVVVCAMSFEGPTSYWRQLPIGAGRAALQLKSMNDFTAHRDNVHAVIKDSIDGVESAIGFQCMHGCSLIVNGKSDGNSLTDTITQVMLGMLPATLHPSPESAFIIGLGTGQTAGWLSRIETMKTVDVVELEPKVVEFADLVNETNFQVTSAENTNIILGDGREVLQTSKRTYDLIISEPSNPYRAGISSMYTVEFYQHISDKLTEDGIFGQWLQTYEIEPDVMATVLRSMGEVFEHTTLFELTPHDFLIVATREPLVADTDLIASKLEREPYRSAFGELLFTVNVEGVLARHKASSALTSELAKRGDVNTDDHPILEFMFSRSVGKRNTEDMASALDEIAMKAGAHTPALRAGATYAFDAKAWEAQRYNNFIRAKAVGVRTRRGSWTPDQRAFWNAYEAGDYADALAKAPSIQTNHSIFDLLAVSETIAREGTQGDLVALSPSLERLAALGFASEANMLRFVVAARRDDTSSARSLALAIIEDAYRDPWIHAALLRRTLALMAETFDAPEDAKIVFDAMTKGHFAGYNSELERLTTMRAFIRGLSRATGNLARECVVWLDEADDSFPQSEETLRFAATCLAAYSDDPERAERALERYERHQNHASKRLRDLLSAKPD